MLHFRKIFSRLWRTKFLLSLRNCLQSAVGEKLLKIWYYRLSMKCIFQWNIFKCIFALEFVGFFKGFFNHLRAKIGEGVVHLCDWTGRMHIFYIPGHVWTGHPIKSLYYMFVCYSDWDFNMNPLYDLNVTLLVGMRSKTEVFRYLWQVPTGCSCFFNFRAILFWFIVSTIYTTIVIE